MHLITCSYICGEDVHKNMSKCEKDDRSLHRISIKVPNFDGHIAAKCFLHNIYYITPLLQKQKVKQL